MSNWDWESKDSDHKSGVNLQYRSEISGQRTHKTHAQLLRKSVLKNACSSTRLRAFDARISFCYSLSQLCFVWHSSAQQKARQKAVPTDTANK